MEELQSLRLDVPQVTLLAHELRKRGVNLPKGILTQEEFVEAMQLLGRHEEETGRCP